MTLEDKKVQLENEIVEINDELSFPNHPPSNEKMNNASDKMRKIRMKIWNIDKRIKLNNKLKKVKDV